MPAVRVQFPAGPLDRFVFGGRGSRNPNNGPADWGSFLARQSSNTDRPTYGREPDTAGRAAVLTQLPERVCGFESLPLRSALVVKRTIIPRFERGVPGSNPGRGAAGRKAETELFFLPRPSALELILWPSGSRRLPDTEEIGGSTPPRITLAAGC
jgi:hypothetical protein